MPFEPKQPPCLSVSSVLFTSSLYVGGSEKSRFVGSGVARNLSRGEQIRGSLGDGSPSAGSRDGADEFTTKMFRILIAR